MAAAAMLLLLLAQLLVAAVSAAMRAAVLAGELLVREVLVAAALAAAAHVSRLTLSARWAVREQQRMVARGRCSPSPRQTASRPACYLLQASSTSPPASCR